MTQYTSGWICILADILGDTKMYGLFLGKALKPFYGTLANLMKIYALIHLEVFVNQKWNKSQNI